MTRDELQARILDTLCTIAPEAADSPPAPDADIRETLDLDSMDFLNLVTALHERFGVEVPETDYPKLSTLAAIASYLQQQSA